MVAGQTSKANNGVTAKPVIVENDFNLSAVETRDTETPTERIAELATEVHALTQEIAELKKTGVKDVETSSEETEKDGSVIRRWLKIRFFNETAHEILVDLAAGLVKNIILAICLYYAVRILNSETLKALIEFLKEG